MTTGAISRSPEEPSAQSDAAHTVHIDTSLQIEQQKLETLAAPVRRALAAFPFSSTSSYARKEFKRAWLQDLALVYKLARGCCQIGDVYDAIRRSTWARPRRLARCMDALNAFLSKNPTEQVDIAVIRVRAHLAEAILSAYVKWERSVTHEYKGTGCIRAEERPIRASDGSIDVTVRQCKRSRIKCSVHTFFQSKRQLFDRIEAAVTEDGDGASEELKKTARTIRAALNDPERLCATPVASQ